MKENKEITESERAHLFPYNKTHPGSNIDKLCDLGQGA